MARELGLAGALLLGALGLGWWVGGIPWFLLAVVTGLLARHLYLLHRFSSWLTDRQHRAPVVVGGLWGEVQASAVRLQRRNRRLKKKLSKSLARFRQSTEAMPDATILIDAAGTIEWFNSAARTLLGLRQPYDVGRNIRGILRHPDALAYLAAEGSDDLVEFYSPVDEFVRLSLRRIPYGKNHRLLIIRDITRLHRLESIRRDFVANVSHELKTPLTVITGYLETLLDGAPADPPHWRRSLGVMQAQADRMGRLVQDLLLLSSLEITDQDLGSEERIVVPALIAGILEDARLMAGEPFVIEERVDPTLWLVGRSEELRSAFSNLLQNALRYTPSDGKATVEWFHDTDGAHFVVTDTGIGIPSQHLSRLTERFFRVDVSRSRDKGGTGLGLAIVKHVLNRHQAWLQVESVVGEGSAFSCHFPAERVLLRSADSNVISLPSARRE